MVEGAIAFEAIERFAARAGIVDVEEFDRFERLIRAMDDEYRAKRQPKGKGEMGNAVSTKDVGGVMALLKRIAGKEEA